MPIDLEGFRVGDSLSSVHYVPEYIKKEEEERLLTEIRASKQNWKTVSGGYRMPCFAAVAAVSWSLLP
jgi:hypothetical protein